MAERPRAAGVRAVAALRIEGGRAQQVTDGVVEEVPVALVYNGHPHAVMMATPTDLADFALGFALTEGVVATPDEFRLVDVLHDVHGISLQAAIPQQRFEALAQRTRVLTGRSGCGLCGIESLQAAIASVPRVDAPACFAPAAIAKALRALHAAQPLNADCGGVHAAAYVDADGILVREDVGRHNAFDKLVGALAVQERRGGFALVTSRASYEIVHKAAMAGIGLVAAISAPTALAIRIADEAGLSLVAFARGERFTIYTHPWRVPVAQAGGVVSVATD